MERFGCTTVSPLENLRKGAVNFRVTAHRDLKFYFLLALTCGMLACTTTAVKRTRATDQPVEKVNLLAVRFFRPDYPVTDPDDFAKVSHELKCVSPSALWTDLLTSEKSAAIIACVNALKETANYIYVPQTQPVLAADPLKNKPDLCLYHLLPALPLPREIYFLALARGKKDQAVYSMSFDTKANEVMDAKVRSSRFETELKFPLREKLQSPQDLQIWLTTLVLSLLRDDQKEWFASLVTDNVVKNCFAGDSLFPDKQSSKVSPVFWP